MDSTREKLSAKLAKYLGKKRYQHSLNVAAAARSLALLHAPELADRAELAGLLHDNAKRLSATELTELAREHDLEVTAGELEQPALLHGKVGAALAWERFGISDAEVLAAMADHVTGRPDMGLLSQMLFVADQSASDRDFPGVIELREVANKDLPKAVMLVAGHKLRYVIETGRPVHPETVAVYNAFAKRSRSED